jgi:GMP synthase-like glutamine amidotransferase
VLLSGGAAAYSETVTWLLDKVVESNLAGKFFPAWGMCFGFEFLIQYGGGPMALQTAFATVSVRLALRWDCTRTQPNILPGRRKM